MPPGESELHALRKLALMALRTKSIADFGRRVRGLTRGYWAGEIDQFTFVDSMIEAVRRGITQAWYQGFRECGFSVEEMTHDERSQLDQHILDSHSTILSFARFIAENSKASGGKLRTCLARAELWTNRYNAVYNEAKAIACADQKLMWLYNPEKEHCVDCLRYHGRVYRASVWKKYGALPQSRNLACGGWRCGCRLVPTDQPCTPGRPPSPMFA